MPWPKLSDSERYVRQLLPQKHGYPLWSPDPLDSLPSEYKLAGVTIGDVGVVTQDGAFDRIFNICSPPGALGVPHGFEKLEQLPGDVVIQKTHYSTGFHIASTKMERKQLGVDISSQGNREAVGLGAGIQLTTTSNEGAVLILPDGGSKHDLSFHATFREYALKHAKSWYEFINGTLGRKVQNGSVYLVTGCDKAASWGVASFSNTPGKDQTSLKFIADASTSTSCCWQWETLDTASMRSGPKRVNKDQENQCVFIRGFRVMMREGLTLPNPSSSQSDEVYHPSTIINKDLLEKTPGCEVAITHDDHWCAILNEGDKQLPEKSEILRRVGEKYRPAILSGGVFLQLKTHTLALNVEEILDKYSSLNLTDLVKSEYSMVTTSGFCDVFRGQSVRHGKRVAIKVLPGNIQTEEKLSRRLIQEISVWSKLSHPNILPLLGFSLRDNAKFGLVSEWMENGTIRDYLVAHPEADKSLMVKGIAEGLKYLHDKDVIHADLKSDNVLISPAGVPLLSDFGIALSLRVTSTIANATTSNLNARWAAIELISDTNISRQEGVHTKASDMWAFGMTIYEILAGVRPFSTVSLHSKVLAIILRGGLPSPPDDFVMWSAAEQKLWELCHQCWRKDPKARPSINIFVQQLSGQASVLNGGQGEHSEAPPPSTESNRWTLTQQPPEQVTVTGRGRGGLSDNSTNTMLTTTAPPSNRGQRGLSDSILGSLLSAPAVQLLSGQRDIVGLGPSENYSEPVLSAAESGHEEVLQMLLRQTGMSADCRDDRNNTPLILAAWNGHEGVARMLLTRPDVSVNSKNRLDETPLLAAAMNGHKAIVQLLLQRTEIEADHPDTSGCTPLLWAARRGHEEIVRLLLERKDVVADSKNARGDTPLTWASLNGHGGVVRRLLDRKDVDVNTKNELGNSPLLLAAQSRHHGVMRSLLEHPDIHANVRDKYGDTVLLCVARDGDENLARLLLARRDIIANPTNQENDTPLTCAARRGQVSVARLLLERTDVDVNWKNKSGDTPLSLACMGGFVDVVRLLLKRTDVLADSPDLHGNTPLIWAARKGFDKVVEVLLERTDVAVDAKNGQGDTPLTWACCGGYEAVVRLLLKRREVDINAKNSVGNTPILLAAQGNHPAVMRLLLTQPGIFADCKDKSGFTPLIWAAQDGHESVVRTLLQRDDVTLDAKSLRNDTALTWASWRGHEGIVRLLLEKTNLDPNWKNEGGRSALSLAAQGGHQSIVRLLLERSQQPAASNTGGGYM